jgi:AcrR family transcriptional regulator
VTAVAPTARSQATRRRIADALVRLHTETGVLPTVGELAERAAIARSSFYVHFDSIEAVLAEMLGAQMALISELGRVGRQGELIAGDSSTLELFSGVLEHVEAHAGLYALLLSPEAAATGHAVAEVLTDSMRASMLRDGAAAVVTPVVLEATVVALGHGLSSLIALRLGGGWPGSRDDLLAVMASLLPGWSRALRTT